MRIIVNRAWALAGLVCGLMALSGCDERPCCHDEAAVGATGAAVASSRDVSTRKEIDESVHTLELVYSDPKIPPGPFLDLFKSNCSTCHTIRYITMQPRLTEKKWTEEVAKMVKVFGAPIKDEQAGQIVQYLVQAFPKR